MKAMLRWISGGLKLFFIRDTKGAGWRTFGLRLDSPGRERMAVGAVNPLRRGGIYALAF